MFVLNEELDFLLGIAVYRFLVFKINGSWNAFQSSLKAAIFSW